MMRTAVLALTLLLIAAPCLNKADERVGPVDFSLQQLHGETVTLSGFRPKWVVLNYWARGRLWKLWVMDRDGTGRKQLTHGNYDVVSHFWSPDGERIAFTSLPIDPHDSASIYVVSAAGNTPERAVSRTEGRDLRGWANSSSFIVVATETCFLLDLEGKTVSSCVSADSIGLWPIGSTGFYLAHDHMRPERLKGRYAVRLQCSLGDIPKMNVRVLLSAERRISLPDVPDVVVWSADFRWAVYSVNTEVWKLDVISGKKVKAPASPAID